MFGLPATGFGFRLALGWKQAIQRRLCRKGRFMGLLLLIVLVLLLVGGLPTWNHSRNWGYGPTGLIGLLLVVLLVVVLFTDAIHFSHF